MAKKVAGASLGPFPFADVEADSGLVSDVPEQLPEEHADADLVSALPSAPMAMGLSNLRLYKGFWLPEWSVPAAVALQRRFEPRRDDVIVASFPKSGTTWVNALTFATMARRAYPAADAGHPLLRLNPHQCIPFLEGLLGSRRGEAKLEALPSPRLMNTHMPLAMMPRTAAPPPGGGGCKVVYVCREPKDMVVSRWHFHRRLHPELPFADVFEAVCSGAVAYGPAWDHMLGYWSASTARPDSVLFLRYEDLLRDPAEHVRALARFVGLPFSGAEEDAGVVDDIVKLCSFGHLKNLEANKTGNLNPMLPIPRDALFRKGVAGDWANHMTPEMARRLDEIVADKLHAVGLAFHEGRLD
ncbi:hypothetical protein CFC21_009183 [Triticum aestivum]|uniref:Sulfotransferase n=2 Tax=Triticum aestivum TaxID=4565 RepID=A0A9R1DHF3_WHEAT|nr:cytosolic sulfotransferase 8-like [Triticum aestivum]KAF6992163.1 hypothetical protein CFC21_009183 [Triticum aestivum]